MVSAEIHTVSPEKVGRAFRVLICIKDVVMSSSKSVTASVWGKHWELPHLEDVAARFGNFCYSGFENGVGEWSHSLPPPPPPGEESLRLCQALRILAC